MAEKRKTKRALNDIRNIGFEKKPWLIFVESVVEDTKFHRSIQVIIKDFEFGHGFHGFHGLFSFSHAETRRTLRKTRIRVRRGLALCSGLDD
jgi:hypothetical protein